ncbi:toll/interleukin-1 receptor domain-containing protein [Oceanidesulfovibrio marinus]|nr:toll/interleukin-1 receptor domain-containing protein [Oceanidesulfovibrio marinus]
MGGSGDLSRRIFLSYGHDEHEVFARRMKSDLEARGHEVWFDDEQLVPGTPDWEHAIEKGLDWVSEDLSMGRFVFLVTPHSARRPDGYCLNELSRALNHKVTIVPVMVVWCELPLSIYRYQWLDMQDCHPADECEDRYNAALDRLCNALEKGRLDCEGAQAGVHAVLEPGLLRYDAEIERHLAGFVGREWLIGRIDTWLRSDDASRMFWLTGKPGSGKSAMASWLCRNRREIAAFHLCDANDMYKADPRRCVLSIAWQLTTQLQEYQNRLGQMDLQRIVQEADPVTLFDRLVAQPLSYSFPRPDRPIVVLVDGLDEATHGGENQLATLLAQGLAKTPRWFRVLITSRPDPEVVHELQSFSPERLDDFEKENGADLRAYLDTHLRAMNNGEAPEDTIIQAIMDRSEGLFLYVTFVVEELRQGRLSLDQPGEFPQGLGGIYAQYFRRQFPQESAAGQSVQQFKSQGRPLLELMAASRAPLSLDCAAKLLEWDEYAVQDVLDAFGSLLVVQDTLLHLFHRTLLEWLTDRRKAGKYFVSTQGGHRRLANAGWAEFHRDPETMGQYAREHLAHHLMAAGRWGDLERFLGDRRVMDFMLEKEREYETLKLWLEIGNRLCLEEFYTKAIERLEAEGLDALEVALLCHMTSIFLWLAARYDVALLLGEKALSIRQQRLNSDHSDIVASMNTVGSLLRCKGEDDAAETLFRRALVIGEKELGSEHPDLAISLHRLASTFVSKGKNGEAEILFRRALAIHEKALGPEHPATAGSLHNLAFLLEVNGQLEEAEELYRRALAIRERALGLEHQCLVMSLRNLAILLTEEGKCKEAEEFYRRSLSINEKTLGIGHPHTAESLNILAVYLNDRGKFEEAEVLHHQALAIRQKALGPEHYLTADSLNNLAIVLGNKGELAMSEKLYRQALAIRKESLGPEHHRTAESLYNLSILLNHKGEFEEAQKLYARAMAIFFSS